MSAREFVPNTPCLVNAGKPNGQLAACFVLDVPDSIAGIMKTATDAAIIHQTGGGTGFTFEKLRPSGSMVQLNAWRGQRSGVVHEHLQYDDRHREAGWRAAWREHGHDAGDASGRSALHSREERSALADELQYLSQRH